MAFRTKWLAVLLSGCALLLPAASRAILTIEITQGVDTGIPVAVVPFAFEGTGQPPQAVSDVLDADLKRSGLFTTVARKDLPATPGVDAEIKPDDWRELKLEGLIVGVVRQLPAGKYEVQFRLLQPYKRDKRDQQLAGYRYIVPPEMLRTVGHQIADLVYEKLAGEKGAFNTRIAYITKEGKRTAPV